MRRGTVVRIWREFNEKPSWRYRELAPGLLLRSLNFVDADMNGSELNRAEWFWRRRPRLILGEGFFGWALVCITVVILFSLPGAFVWLGVDSFTSLGLALGWIFGSLRRDSPRYGSTCPVAARIWAKCWSTYPRRDMRRESSSPLIQQMTQPLFYGRPLRSHNRVARWVASGVVGGHPMGSKNTVKMPTDPFERSARALVSFVRVEADAERLPHFESMRQHKQLALGIGAGPDRWTGQPSVTDLTGIRGAPAMKRVALRPSPWLEIPEPGRANDDAVIHADNCEWHRAPGFLAGQRGINIAGHLFPALRDETPLIQRRVRCRRRHQAVNVPVLKGFETHMPPRQGRISHHHSGNYAMGYCGRNGMCEQIETVGGNQAFSIQPDLLPVPAATPTPIVTPTPVPTRTPKRRQTPAPTARRNRRLRRPKHRVTSVMAPHKSKGSAPANSSPQIPKMKLLTDWTDCADSMSVAEGWTLSSVPKSSSIFDMRNRS